jgi:hypothetical protein
LPVFQLAMEQGWSAMTVSKHAASSRFANVLTDIHFWVPVAVLVAGLLLLSFIR